MVRKPPWSNSKRSREEAEEAEQGFRTLGMARSDSEGAWHFLGLLPLFDPPREDSAETIKHAGEHGIAVKMVTGDNLAIAKQIASQLGLGTDIHVADKFFKDGDEQRTDSPQQAFRSSSGQSKRPARSSNG
jgi:H+-transporting ATPase